MKAVRSIAAGLCAVALALYGVSATAQSYPSRSIRIIVPLAPGGGNDTAARLVGHQLAEALGQQVIVENRPGGGGVVASEIVARAPPDGYTLYLVSTSFTLAPALHKNLPFDSLRDFVPITRVTVAPGALIVHRSLPVNSVKDLIALAKARPGQVTFGSAGPGSASHVGGELFNMLAGVKLLHVPYKGSSLATVAVLSGEVAVAFTNPTASMPHIKSGRLKMIAVTTGKRWPLLPDIPTIAESGVPGYEVIIWSGLSAPTGTPQAVLARLHKEVTQILNSPDLAEHLAKDGARPFPESPEEFAAFLKAEIAKWIKVARQAHMIAG